VTTPLKMSSSESPACASSSCGKYTLPLLALKEKWNSHSVNAWSHAIFMPCSSKNLQGIISYLLLSYIP
jgi:hypothetical protein